MAKKKASKKKSSKDKLLKVKGVQMVTLWGDSDDDESKGRRTGKQKIRRNPWVPTDIIILMKFMCTYGATKAFVELAKAWMNYRSARKIEIKVGDYELKVEGSIGDRALESRINKFKDLIHGATYDDIDVILPKGANRRMPPKRSR